MTRVKVSEADGKVLDWMVAKCEGNTVKIDNEGAADGFFEMYSTSWAQAGPIIEREKISIRQWTNVPIVHAYMPIDGAEWSSDGGLPLVAAMRCFVASKLGDEVDIPKELT